MQKIVELYQEGLTIYSISKKTGIPPSTVYSRLKRKGVQIRPKSKLLNVQPKTIRDFYWKRSLTLEEVAKLFNVSPGAVQRRMKELNIPRRKGRLKGKFRRGITKKCAVCRKKFYVPQNRAKTAKYCSRSCKARDAVPWNKGKKLDHWRRITHDKLVEEEEKIWGKEGFRFIPLTVVVPDAIAIDFQHGKVYAIEIERRSNIAPKKLRKYDGITYYDDIHWIRFKKGKPLNKKS